MEEVEDHSDIKIRPAILNEFSENHKFRFSQAELDRKVAWKLLLHPGPLALPQQFVFTDRFAAHFNSCDFNPIFHAMENKLAVILSEFDGVQSFSELREKIPVGRGAAERPHMIPLARKLDGFANMCEWRVWPDAMGKSYYDSMSNLLSDADRLKEKVFDDAAGMRFHGEIEAINYIIETASIFDPMDNRRDLRFTQIVNTIGRECFGLNNLLSVTDLSIPLNSQSSKLLTKKTIDDLVSIASFVYDQNQGRRNSMPYQKLWHTGWIGSLFSEHNLDKKSGDEEPIYYFSVKLPNRALLNEITPDEFFEIQEKRKPYIQAYSSILRRGNTPLEDRVDELDDALQIYSEFLCNKSKDQAKDYLVSIPKRTTEYVAKRFQQTRNSRTSNINRVRGFANLVELPTKVGEVAIETALNSIEFHAVDTECSMDYYLNGHVDMNHS